LEALMQKHRQYLIEIIEEAQKHNNARFAADVIALAQMVGEYASVSDQVAEFRMGRSEKRNDLIEEAKDARAECDLLVPASWAPAPKTTEPRERTKLVLIHAGSTTCPREGA